MAPTSMERRWLLAIWDAMLPSNADPGLPLGASDVPLDRFLTAFYRDAPGESRLGVRLATWVVTWAPLLWRLKLRPFHRLSPEDQVACLEALTASRLYVVREVVNLLKIIGAMGWCGLPEVQRALGMPQPDATPAPWAVEDEY